MHANRLDFSELCRARHFKRIYKRPSSRRPTVTAEGCAVLLVAPCLERKGDQ